jgi:hypothetical protein
MGLGLSDIRLYLELYQRGILENCNSIAEIGSQELHIDIEDFKRLVAAAGFTSLDDAQFARWNWPGFPRCSAGSFYNLLGIDDYVCVDMNGEHGSIPLDLNLPLEDKSLYGRYGLVSDHGCNEHAFNVAEAYRTMHRLCKHKGILINHQSVWGGNGYYLFDLSFFEGMAAANNYSIIYSSYVVTLHDRTGAGSSIQYHIPLSRELLDVLDRSKVKAIGITYVFQKQSEADFHYPYQGSLMSDKMENNGYELQFFPEVPARAYIPTYIRGSLNNIRTKTLFNHLCRRLLRIARLVR